jgi:energy-coupling factor transporter ATP-binding protein EcfA2
VGIEATTLLVGPNNSGKSLALREIEQLCTANPATRPYGVIGEIDVDLPVDLATAESILQPYEVAPEFRPPGHLDYLTFELPRLSNKDTRMGPFTLIRGRFDQMLQENKTQELRSIFIAPFTVRLDGRTRFELLDPQPAQNLFWRSPQNYLSALMRDDTRREQVQRLVFEATGRYFVIDHTSMSQLMIRLSSRPPVDKYEEQSLDMRSFEFHTQATPIFDFGDGVQAFVGLVASISASPYKIVLLDEPEAFLHPPLARRLGANLTRMVDENKASLVVATHSASFVIGCLETSKNVSVVRLTYENKIATARPLPSSTLDSMMRDPLLRTTGILHALFHRGALVVEADADRAFYDAINQRLRAVGRGTEDIVFLAAVGKDTVHKLVEPLRRIGIPAVALMDLDVLEYQGTAWDNILDACQMPQSRRQHYESERDYFQRIFKAIPASNKDQRAIKTKGVDAVVGADLARLESLLQEFAGYGLFLVPQGQLESWLKPFNVTEHGPKWLIEVFARMGLFETDTSYLRPAVGDVWAFLDGVAAWINNPSRRGVS